MKLTFVGHAGLYVEAGSTRILCDPWLSPAYHHTWWPYLYRYSRDAISWPQFLHTPGPTHLYISHLHEDHFDRTLLAQVSRDVTIILPDFPLTALEDAYSKLGFHN